MAGTGSCVVLYMTSTPATLAMAENHVETNSTMLQHQAECCHQTDLSYTHPRSPPPNSSTHQTQILESGKMGEMGGNGKKWKMEENRRKWGKWVWGVGGIGGRAHGMWVVEGCGGMWLRKMGENMGEKWDQRPIFHGSIFPIFPEVEDLPHSPHSVKYSLGQKHRRKQHAASKVAEMVHTPTPVHAPRVHRV